MSDFLPISKQDLKERDIEGVDFVLVTGDAYVDHPSFGAAIIGRLLESKGFTVGVLAQPDWKTAEAFTEFGRPRLGFLVTAGNIDSMVAHYTVAKRPREDDAYSPGGKNGYRPDRAVIVYCNRIREAYGDIPIILGGLEASLRRFAHYDYWEDKVRRSILVDSGADLVVYGMGEHQMETIARLLDRGVPMEGISGLPGTCVLRRELPKGEYLVCPSFEQVRKDKKAYAEAARLQYEEHDPIRGRTLVQPHGLHYLIQYPPAQPLPTEELDRVYALPFTRQYHPVYEKLGGVPALDEVEFSITSSRGCFGACNFCSLAFHQGRMVTSRSHESILKEAESFTHNKDFKGYISDVGGPTANFRSPSCKKQMKAGMCKNRACLAPEKCPNLEVDHSDYLALLQKLRALPGIKKVFIRSGIRFDYLIYDKNDAFFKELVAHHISGQLKVAPEHVSNNVLKVMGKPKIEVYEKFREKYLRLNREQGKDQYLVPYLMSSHPGATLKDAVKLAEYLKKINYRPRQVQDFYPTPGTVSTCMYYTGIDPRTGKEVFVPRTRREKQLQRALLQYFRPENRDLVETALKEAGRADLIGFSGKALIKPAQKTARGPYPKRRR